MKIAIRSDRAGFELEECVQQFPRQLKQEVLDLATHYAKPVDHPDFAWYGSTFGTNLTVQPIGGHLGNLHIPAVQEALVRMFPTAGDGRNQ